MIKYKETRYSTNGKYKVFGILFEDNALPIIHVDIIHKKKRIFFTYTNQGSIPKYVLEICEEIQRSLINQKSNT